MNHYRAIKIFLSKSSFKLSISAILATWLFALLWYIFFGSQIGLLFYTFYMYTPGVVAILYWFHKNSFNLAEKLNFIDLIRGFFGKFNISWFVGVLGVFIAAFVPFLIYAILEPENFDLASSLTFRNLFLRMLYIFLIGNFLALGEEVAWRQIIFNKIKEDKLNQLVFSSLVWVIWHFPLIFFFGYNGGLGVLNATITFSLTIFIFGLILAKLKNLSQSLFLITFLHALHNLLQQNFFPSFFVPSAQYKSLTGEFGVFTIIIYLLVFLSLHLIFEMKTKNNLDNNQ